jgi:hypothetical protein
MINKHEGTLGNSNQRESKGFSTTYATTRTVGPVGRFKLDWIFVKSYLSSPENHAEPYLFAPHFARTMETVNYSIEDRISDHNPISLDLPFGEPDPEAAYPSRAPAVFGSWQPHEWTKTAKHRHFPMGSCSGKLTLRPEGLSYRSPENPDHSHDWKFTEIQDVRRPNPGEIEIKLPRKEGSEIQIVTGNDYKFEFQGDGISNSEFRCLAEFMRAAKNKANKCDLTR